MTVEFVKYPKIPRPHNAPRLRVTEKIDGTNAQIVIEDGEIVAVGSRNRWIKPGPTTDNYEFAQFVADNRLALERLGNGRHYGEWFGRGIGRNYGMEDRKFALFSPMWSYGVLRERGVPESVVAVPVLYDGEIDTNQAYAARWSLILNGSVMVPGFMQPEGIVADIFGNLVKYIIDKKGPSPEEPVSA